MASRSDVCFDVEDGHKFRRYELNLGKIPRLHFDDPEVDKLIKSGVRYFDFFLLPNYFAFGTHRRIYKWHFIRSVSVINASLMKKLMYTYFFFTVALFCF